MIPTKIYKISLTLDKEWETYTTEFKNMDVSLDQMFESFIGMLVASGWMPEMVYDHIIERAEELKELNNIIKEELI
jgi:hypothetical protein